jgi:hypothetical protein
VEVGVVEDEYEDYTKDTDEFVAGGDDGLPRTRTMTPCPDMGVVQKEEEEEEAEEVAEKT